MKTRRSIVIYWILLLIPTLVVAGMAFILLSHEQERLRGLALQSLKDRITAIAESVHLTVAEVEETMTRSLLAIDRDRVQPTLLEWEASNPLVRNVFVWNQGRGLAWPAGTLAFTREERMFVARYESLFSGRMAWEFSKAVSAEETRSTSLPASVSKAESVRVEGFKGQMEQLASRRQGLLDLARPGTAAMPGGAASPASLAPADSGDAGWIPWFAENRLFLLGWVKRGDMVYGVELELMTLLSRLVVALPTMEDKGAFYVLVDGTGQRLYQSGDVPSSLSDKPEAVIAVSKHLPHWQMHLYLEHGALETGRGFVAVSGILLAIFAAAILLGGGLLTWQARMNRKDAMQKTSFVSSVSHELKTPLTTIRMYAELLLSGRITAREKTDHYLSVIVAESQRLTRLVNNVLDFSRIEEQRKTYRPSPVDLGEMLTSLVAAHAIRFRDAGMDVRVDVPDEPLGVTIDRDALEQVVLNLIDNAVKYAAVGGVLDIQARGSAGGACEIRFLDRGPGIPLEHRAAVFETFYRVDNSLTAEQPGSGLGLSIARTMLRDLHGDLVFEPNPAGGSCFTIRIPSNDTC